MFLSWLPSNVCYLLPGGRSRGKQLRGLHTKALMQGLGTRLECRHRCFVSTEKEYCGNLLPEKNGWSRRGVESAILEFNGEAVALITDAPIIIIITYRRRLPLLTPD